ncbi:homocitrate synthase [Clostridium polyendosporum]|uniref:Homocitrate synthase n=1 Tax=Clostridium polyendosporum TaxID=69208 RepID=A0A919VDH9_9CLOT|nr:hypothetical protein [Clostridium polyendosporum]GIM28019.1 homocitrate synthase [Clostridium polyendosporum]
MSLYHNNRELKIIDATLPRNIQLKESMVSSFINLSKEIGVDLFLIDQNLLKKIKIEDHCKDFILYVKNIEEFNRGNRLGINKFMITYDAIVEDYLFYEKLVDIKETLILEIPLSILKRLDLNWLRTCIKAYSISSLVISHIDYYEFSHLPLMIEELRESLNVEVILFPTDRFSMGTAIVLEGAEVSDGIICGFNGGDYGMVSMEEALVGLKVINKFQLGGSIGRLSELKEIYENLMGVKVRKCKAVIGEEIFDFESGIHADGIAKDPHTYEPYEPGDVGMKRRLIIGKHSGTKSLKMKLIDLEIDYSPLDLSLVLETVREWSIKMRRGLNDGELLSLIKGMNIKSIGNR